LRVTSVAFAVFAVFAASPRRVGVLVHTSSSPCVRPRRLPCI
jgi:hypothetical protein